VTGHALYSFLRKKMINRETKKRLQRKVHQALLFFSFRVGDSVSFSGWGKDACKSRGKKRSDPQILAATDFDLMMCIVCSWTTALLLREFKERASVWIC